MSILEYLATDAKQCHSSFVKSCFIEKRKRQTYRRKQIRLPSDTTTDLVQKQDLKELENTLQSLGIDGSTYSANLQLKGDVIFHRMMGCLMSFDWKPSEQQTQFLQQMLYAIIPIIYGEEWMHYSHRILSRLKLDEIYQNLVISTPRRFGKTISVAMFGAACVYCLRGRTISIFAKNKRQSGKLMGTVKRLLLQLHGSERMIVQDNNETLLFSVLCNRNDVNMTTLSCYPGNADAIRGVGADIIILEEAGFVSEDLFYEGIAPLLGVVGTSVIGISTPPTEDDNYYLELFEVKDPDTGKPIFNTIKIERLCPKCKEEGNDECPHMKHTLPKWKSKRLERQLAAIYGTNKLRYMREILGVHVTTSMAAFDKKDVANFIDRPYMELDYMPRFVFLTIDPSGGGQGSDTSWTITSYTHGYQSVLILGAGTIDNSTLGTDREAQIISQHANRVRSRNPKLNESTIFVVTIESNHCYHRSVGLVQGFRHLFVGNYYLISEDSSKQDRPGVWVTHEDKHRFVARLSSYLSTNNIAVSKHYLSNRSSGVDKDPVLITLYEQIRKYKRKRLDPRNVDFNDPRYTFSGKSSGVKDDIVTSLMIGLYWSGVFMGSVHYMKQFGKRPVLVYGAMSIDDHRSVYSQRRIQARQ